jgi:hypothetical protein
MKKLLAGLLIAASSAAHAHVDCAFADAMSRRMVVARDNDVSIDKVLDVVETSGLSDDNVTFLSGVATAIYDTYVTVDTVGPATVKMCRAFNAKNAIVPAPQGQALPQP